MKKHRVNILLVLILTAALLVQWTPRSQAVADGFEELVSVQNTDAPPPMLPRQHGTDPRGLLAHAEDEAALLHYVLQAASGDITCDIGTGDPDAECLVNTDFESMARVALVRCERLDPSALRHAPAFDRATMGATVGALESACNRLEAAVRTHGRPQESPQWRTAVQAAKAEIKKAGVKQ